MTFLQTFADPSKTAQTERTDPRQVQNAAGGYVFPTDGWELLNRWLILGTQGGTYYTDEKTVTETNIDLVRECIKRDGPRVVRHCLDVSTKGLAAKQDYALFTLAMCIGSRDPNVVHDAYAALPMICRTGSTFFQLLSYLRGLRSSADRNAKGEQKALFTGNGLKRAVARWFNLRPTDQLAYQMVKYRQRYGIEVADALRLAHPNPLHGAVVGSSMLGAGDVPTLERQWGARNSLYRWGAGKPVDFTPAADEAKIAASIEDLPQIVRDFTIAQAFTDIENVEATRVRYSKVLPREALPTSWLQDPKVWEALLYGASEGEEEAITPGTATGKTDQAVKTGMPIGALVRNLGNLSKCDLLVAGSDAERYVCGELMNQTRIRAGRVHPIAIYLAAKVYALGHSIKGDGVWAPSRTVIDALETAFELAFDNVEPTNVPQLIAVDSSSSMTAGLSGFPNITCREIAMAFAFVLMKTEPNAKLIGFTEGSNTTEFKVAPNERLRDLVTRFERSVAPNGTDLTIPFKFARHNALTMQAVTTLTDGETWAGKGHVYAEIETLRKVQDFPVRVITIAATAQHTQVTDPNDKNALGVAGFSPNVPTLVRGFINGAF